MIVNTTLTLKKTCALIILTLPLLFFACKPSTPSAFETIAGVKKAVSEKDMVVSGHPLATQAGLDILNQGGNAVDATVATQFALAVVLPRAGNIGGGGFAVFRFKDGTSNTLDFREVGPISAHKDMYLFENGEVIPSLSTKGGKAVGVPGTVDGLLTMWEKYGKIKDLSVIMKNAIEYAERGFKISVTEAERFNRYEEDFRAFSDNSIPFLKPEPWKANDLLIQPNLARTLKKIAKEGRKGFYEGAVAEDIIREANEHGGILQAKDFTDYKSKWREPLTFDYNEYDFITMGPPSSGGVVLRQMFEMLEEVDLDKLPFHSTQYIHTIAELERRSYADRAEYLGDVDFVNVPLDVILDTGYLEEKWADFDPNKATKSTTIKPAEVVLPESFETTHTSVIDAEGNAVSLTYTINGNFGSKVFAPEAGCFLNNEMDDFSAKPGVANMFGLVGTEANAIAAGKRMLSSMTPTIIEKDGELYMVLGAPGGSTIITGVFQVVLNVIHKNIPLEEAVNAGRFHHQWLPDLIIVEKGAFPETVLDSLREMGHEIKERKYMAIVKPILKEGKKLTGVGDPRNPDDHAQGN